VVRYPPLQKVGVRVPLVPPKMTPMAVLALFKKKFLQYYGITRNRIH